MNDYITGLLGDNAKLSLPIELAQLRDLTKSEGVPTILTDGLNELMLLCGIKQPKTILELGTATGCSGIAMLLSGENSTLYTIENRERSFNAARENFARFNLTERVKQYLGDAIEVLPTIDCGFDFVFLDCNKSKYKDLLPVIKSKMNKGGVLFADNVLFRGYVSGEVKPPHRFNTIKNNMRTFLSMITHDKDFITTVSDVGDGISISLKK